MDNSFYSKAELRSLGFKFIGKDCLISKKASFYNKKSISIGNNVRIDDYCLLSGKINLGSYIHISAYTSLYGKFGIEMHDFTGLSPRSIIFSASDDFNSGCLIGPMVNEEDCNLIGGKVIMEEYSQIGAGSIVMPNLTIHKGAVTGAMTLVNKDLLEWRVYVGIPARYLRGRERTDLGAKYL